MKTITVLDLLEMDLREHDELRLKCIGGRQGLGRSVEVPELNRPGLALSGFYESFAFKRIQVFGRGECAYLRKLEQDRQDSTICQFFEYEIPCVIFTNSLDPPEVFFEKAESRNCPVLQTDLSSTDFSVRIIRALSNVFAPRVTIHGVMVEVFGIGVLILGESGVGKSEAALELIERGHRLVADDAIELRCVAGNIIMGAGANKKIGHHMEIRGMGIINITHLFGVGAIRDRKQVQLVVELEHWTADKEYDRLGTVDQHRDLLGVKVPNIKMPIKPGRNIPVLIETAAMNERLKKMGFHTAKEFNRNVLNWLESESAKGMYNQQDSWY